MKFRHKDYVSNFAELNRLDSTNLCSQFREKGHFLKDEASADFLMDAVNCFNEDVEFFDQMVRSLTDHVAGLSHNIKRLSSEHKNSCAGRKAEGFANALLALSEGFRKETFNLNLEVKYLEDCAWSLSNSIERLRDIATELRSLRELEASEREERKKAVGTDKLHATW